MLCLYIWATVVLSADCYCSQTLSILVPISLSTLTTSQRSSTGQNGFIHGACLRRSRSAILNIYTRQGRIATLVHEYLTRLTHRSMPVFYVAHLRLATSGDIDPNPGPRISSSTKIHSGLHGNDSQNLSNLVRNSPSSQGGHIAPGDQKSFVLAH